MKESAYKNYFIGLLFWVAAANNVLCSCAKSTKINNEQTPVVPPDATEQKPVLTGKLLYHSYTCYTCNDSKLYLYDFTTNTNSLLSDGWAIDNPMNAHFSPDGTKIVFMGLQKGTSNWDVFYWTINSPDQPKNLTMAFGDTRDEDPNFSNNGNLIIFKHSGHLAEMDLSGNIIRTLTAGSGEESMPCYNYNDSTILYAEGAGAASDIYMIDTSGANIKKIVGVPNVQEYFPVAKDTISFFYTAWQNTNNHNDQLYLGFYNGIKLPQYLPFNTSDANYSDAGPCGKNYLFLSSTKADSKGGYDLYIANIVTGKIWSLSQYNSNINSAKEELGASYLNR